MLSVKALNVTELGMTMVACQRAVSVCVCAYVLQCFVCVTLVCERVVSEKGCVIMLCVRKSCE